MASGFCSQCGKPLGAWDIGAHRKLIWRNADQGFLCVGCIARRFGCEEERMWQKLREFQETGCTLFPVSGEGIPDEYQKR